MASIQQLSGRAFLAFPETEAFLDSELRERFALNSASPLIKHYGSLSFYPADVLSAAKATSAKATSAKATSAKALCPYWASTVMEEPFILRFKSIKEAASSLKEIQRNWASYQYTQFRRSSLIQDALPYINLKARTFPIAIPQTPMGLYTLIDENTLIASAKTTSPLPSGLLQLVEDHENPPSRAYLKIQESLTQAINGDLSKLPQKGERCLDAGACPGGWTWVLAQLGCKITAVDRAPLDERLMSNSDIEFLKHDAFTLSEKELGTFDWIFSDVICYPERLLEWVKTWLASSKPPKMICTIKMQGKTDWDIIEQFASIPNSRVLHLFHNKHELTFIHV